MVVNKIFGYSKEAAKQNGNRLPIIETIISIVFFIASLVILSSLKMPKIVIIFTILGFLSIIIYFSIKIGLSIRNKSIGWACTEDNRVYKIVFLPGLINYFTGTLIGSLVGQAVPALGEVASTIGGAIGFGSQVADSQKQSKLLESLKLINDMIQSPEKVSKAMLYEIIKVYSITEKKKSYTIVCDYKLIKTSLIKKEEILYNKKIKIDKSYEKIEELINVLNQLK